MLNKLQFVILLSCLMAVVAGNFYQDADITWGEGRGKIENGGQQLSLSLDKLSGSGFQSKNEYLFGRLDLQLKLVPGNSAGTVTTFFVLAPLPIGFVVFMVHLATIPITGNGINPARSFGAVVIDGHKKPWDDHWIFWVGPFIGAAIAAIYHQYILRAGAVKALGSFKSTSSSYHWDHSKHILIIPLLFGLGGLPY